MASRSLQGAEWPIHVYVYVSVFRVFPREYLLQQIHLYSLADLQQVSAQKGPRNGLCGWGLTQNDAVPSP